MIKKISTHILTAATSQDIRRVRETSASWHRSIMISCDYAPISRAEVIKSSARLVGNEKRNRFSAKPRASEWDRDHVMFGPFGCFILDFDPLSSLTDHHFSALSS